MPRKLTPEEIKSNDCILSIGRLEMDGDRWKAVMQDVEGFWYVANVENIPREHLDDNQYHVFEFHPQSQHCIYLNLTNHVMVHRFGGDHAPKYDVAPK